MIRLYNSGEKSVEILCNEDGFVINEVSLKTEKIFSKLLYRQLVIYRTV